MPVNRSRMGRREFRHWRRRLAPDPWKDRPKARPSLAKRIKRILWVWWPWAVLGVALAFIDEWGWAAASGAFAFVTFVITPAERAPQFGLDHQFAIAEPVFLSTILGATGEALLPNNRITILNNGDEFYPSMLEAIRNARRSITIEAYIYWAGEIGREFADALAERSAAGVRVKILLDSVGSKSIGGDILRILEQGKCQVAWYNPLRWYSVGRLNHRTHRKSLIVDGNIAFTGGAGIADHWRGHAQDADHWRDIQIRIEGPAARPLQTGFAHNWLQTTSELVSGDDFYPPVETEDRGAGSTAAVVIVSSPEVGASSVRTMYYLAIACARKSLYITNPYFVPDEVAIAALVDAKRRGVDVRIVIAGVHNDSKLARRNSVRLYGQLLRGGITLLEYNRTMLHQKTMVADGLFATVGTTNFDNRSFSHNEENNVCVYDAAWASELERIFLADAKLCDVVDFDTWRRRSLVEKCQEFFASFLEDQV